MGLGVAFAEIDGWGTRPLLHPDLDGLPKAAGRGILPFYLVCDESVSIDSINAALPELLQEVGSDPVLADRIHLCIIESSDDARVLLPLCDLSRVTELPRPATLGARKPSWALQRLRIQIDSDVDRLRASGNWVYRPVAFLLTDGAPNGTHRQADYQVLNDPGNALRPNIVAFSLDQRDNASVSLATAVSKYGHLLTRSVTLTADATGCGTRQELPMNIDGPTPSTAGQQVLPFYLVCDESGSMSGDPIDSINTALPELHQEIGSNPVVADKTQFCIIGFSDDAEVLLPLSDLSQVTELPILETRGGTSFAEAFRVLKLQIDSDVAQLKAAGNQVFRPVVFFMTDGYPTDASWSADYQALTDSSNPLHPKIVAFGIGDADEATVASVATFRAFVSDNSMSPGAALREFAGALTKTLVKTGTTATAQGMTLQTPEHVPGFRSLNIDQV